MHFPWVCPHRTASPNVKPSAINRIQSAHEWDGCFSIHAFSAIGLPRYGHVLIGWTLLVGLLIFALPSISSAAQVTLKWHCDDQNATGYRVYQRRANESFNYNQPAWPKEGYAMNKTTCTIENLADQETYYFIVRAYGDKRVSKDSNEVEFLASADDPNQPPVAMAGARQSVTANALVHIDGSGSYDAEGDALTYQFKQTGGPDVNLDCKEDQCTFTAPQVSENTVALAFSLTVIDGLGLSDSATTVVLVYPDRKQPDLDVPDQGDKSGVGERDDSQRPGQPIVKTPENGGSNIDLSPWIIASAFEGFDKTDLHMLTQWRIIDTATEQKVLNLIGVHNNQTELKVPPLVLDPATAYSVQVRYFDNKGRSSIWSKPSVIFTGEDIGDIDGNRIPDDLEVSPQTDLNNDALADVDQDDIIKSFSTQSGLQMMGISIEPNGPALGIDAVTSIDPFALETQPAHLSEFPYDLLGCKIPVSIPGESVYTIIYLSEPIDPQRTRWTRYDAVKGWQGTSDDTVVDANGYVVERTLQDGGEEDADGVANGVIIDLSGPAYPNDRSIQTSSDNGSTGSGGGVCFIQSMFD